MKMKNIIVTGGAGFIGSNIVKELYKKNNVTIIDDISTGNFKNISNLVEKKEVKFIKGSVTNYNLLQKNFKNVDFVYHQAAIPSVPRSIKNPIKSNCVNVNGTLNVLLAAKKNAVKKVIYASLCVLDQNGVGHMIITKNIIVYLIRGY